MVRFSIRKKFWKALGLLYQITVEMTGKRRKRRGQMTETTGETTEMTGKPRTGFLLNIRLGMLSSVVSWFPPPWCHGVLPGFGLKIRLEMLSSVVSWFPSPWCHGVLPGSWLEIRLEICLCGFP